MLAVIPARGGSRGVPRKNIRSLGGHPLLAYTVAAACAATRLTRCVVSTDDEAIASVAAGLDVEVVERPTELATDTAPTAPVLLHALSRVEGDGTQFDYILTLQPTTPFRLGTDIDAAIALLDQLEASRETVTSVVRLIDAHPARAKRLIDRHLVNYCEEEREGTRRQDLAPAFLRNGAVYAARRQVVLEGSVRGSAEIGYEMPAERSVNIDEPMDFLLAEAVLRAGLVKPDLLVEQ